MSTALAEPKFTDLNEAEQRIVAERIQRIKESGWLPFWCKRKHCDGAPHPLEDKHGYPIIVTNDLLEKGPNGEPIGNLYETLSVDGKPGHQYVAEIPEATDTFVARVLMDKEWNHQHAREDQRLPPWRKAWTLFIMSGRGAGKTTTGVEFVTLCARKGLDGAIVGRRGTELENTHVATIIARAHPEFVPEYKSSKDILVWPNGAITYLFSAERPENIRSVNLSYVWFDEAAHMDEVKKAWTNAKFAARVKSPGNPIHMLITSTPTPTPWVMDMEDDPKVIVRRVSTYANKANLDEDFLADLEADYEGTRIGRQELHGEVLRDVEGALWNDGLFRHRRVTAEQWPDLIDSMDERVVAIDPAGSANKRSDLTGIIAVGTQHFDENGDYLRASTFHVLLDGTLKDTPTEWARRAFKVARLVRAHRIIAEKNFGGAMVKQVLDDFAKLHPDEALNEDGEDFRVEVVHAVEGKETRAEGTVAKYEQGRVDHCSNETKIGKDKVGDLSMLEKEQVGWVPKSRGGRMPSPNRIDALVWAVRALESKRRFKAAAAKSKDVLNKMTRAPRAQRVGGSTRTRRIGGKNTLMGTVQTKGRTVSRNL